LPKLTYPILLPLKILKMKIIIDCKKKSINETCITHWLIGGNLLMMTTMIKFWNEKDEVYMLNKWYKKVFIEMKMVTRCNSKDEENEFFPLIR